MSDFSSSIKHLEGHLIEIYQSVTHNDHNYAEYVMANKSVLIGKLVKADGESIVVDCIAYTKPNHKILRMYLNTWTITAVAEIDPKNNLSMYDAYWSSEEVAKSLKKEEEIFHEK